ncbi:FAD-binding oxidoreductase [Pseudenhygromyxa sp. WMMC2535]|uniref:FAD-binding oxidoreductase n=1 Tax=Pseudenhygromyxa sp. WMMC2535 TaxID=2712867 RepID=UPI001555A640|nr:FAD-binding oxidoreductase [Pseudenhygromyxa sp. WMMC2535]NVB38038.1 FAD-binding oxidoreductase [Pseudenhygromyxa sp. WMMC2535]
MPGFRRADDPDFLAALRERIGEAQLRSQPEDLAYYGADRCKGGWPVAPGVIALPRTVEQVQAIVELCAARGVAIVPSGGRTGLTGAATATGKELVLSLERLDAILEVDATSRLLRCQAGATVEAVQQAAAGVGLEYPVDFAAKGSAHIAGSVATNAGGVKVIRHGLTRDWVSGLEVVLASGERLSLGGELIKNNTGYDLRQLFIGSEGTLGVIVELTLKLAQPAPGHEVALCSLRDDEALLELFSRLRAAPLTLSAFECFDRGCIDRVIAHRGVAQAGPLAELGPMQALIEIERGAGEGSDDERDDAEDTSRDRLLELLADAQDEGLVLDAALAAGEAQARELWAWREDISESLHPHTPHKADVAVPVREVVRFVGRWRAAVAEALPEIPALCFGHVGDGNLHLNLLCPEGMALEDFLARCHSFDPTLYGLVRDHRGSVSAEHGIGLLKRDYLGHTRSAREVEIMRAIKQVFDPTGVLNPGKLFPPRS